MKTISQCQEDIYQYIIKDNTLSDVNRNSHQNSKSPYKNKTNLNIFLIQLKLATINSLHKIKKQTFKSILQFKCSQHEKINLLSLPKIKFFISFFFKIIQCNIINKKKNILIQLKKDAFKKIKNAVLVKKLKIKKNQGFNQSNQPKQLIVKNINRKQKNSNQLKYFQNKSQKLLIIIKNLQKIIDKKNIILLFQSFCSLECFFKTKKQQKYYNKKKNQNASNNGKFQNSISFNSDIQKNISTLSEYQNFIISNSSSFVNNKYSSYSNELQRNDQTSKINKNNTDQRRGWGKQTKNSINYLQIIDKQISQFQKDINQLKQRRKKYIPIEQNQKQYQQSFNNQQKIFKKLQFKQKNEQYLEKKQNKDSLVLIDPQTKRAINQIDVILQRIKNKQSQKAIQLSHINNVNIKQYNNNFYQDKTNKNWSKQFILNSFDTNKNFDYNQYVTTSNVFKHQMKQYPKNQYKQKRQLSPKNYRLQSIISPIRQRQRDKDISISPKENKEFTSRFQYNSIHSKINKSNEGNFKAKEILQGTKQMLRLNKSKSFIYKERWQEYNFPMTKIQNKMKKRFRY